MSRTSRIAFSVALLLVAFALDSYTVYSVSKTDEVTDRPTAQIVTDPRELAALRNSVVGHYSTGSEPGDRRIEIAADGQIRFIRLTSGGARQDSDDSYRVARLDGRVCLATMESGFVYVSNIDTVVYSNDSYRRIR